MSTYAKIEHSLYDNPKIVGLSCEAFRAYVEGILYSGKNLTDGFLDERIVSRMWGVQVAEELTTNDPTNPSWERVEGGWLIYGFTERQNTKEDVDAMRERKSAAGKASAAKRKQESNKNSTEVQQPVEQKLNTDSTEVQPDTDTDTYINTSLSELKSSDEKIFSQEVYSLCDELAQLIRANGNKVGTVGANWWKAADRLIRLDGHSPELIEQVMYWSQANEFWQGNILSMPKFREQFDKLRTRMQNEKPKQAEYSGYAPGVVTRGEAPEGRRYAADIIEDWES
jgi:hypothetical protein